MTLDRIDLNLNLILVFCLENRGRDLAHGFAELEVDDLPTACVNFKHVKTHGRFHFTVLVLKPTPDTDILTTFADSHEILAIVTHSHRTDSFIMTRYDVLI